jgi:predicted DNA-binding transcriptional regulator YafY
MRSFRADRAIDIRLEDGPFHEDPTFNPNDHMEPGRVFSGDGDLEAVIRYSPNVARWVAETEDGEWDSDGSLRVRHKVADPGWLVRHVLQYGGEAEVLSPAELRASVREAAAALLARREL